MALFDAFRNESSPVANPGRRRPLFDDSGTNTLMSATALPAGNGWRRSEVIFVPRLRYMVLEIQINNAATAIAQLAVEVWLSSDVSVPIDAATPPAYASDVWYQPSVTDGTVTATADAGTPPTGQTATIGPLNGRQVYRPLVILSPLSTTNSSKIRMGINVNVTGARWFYAQVSEVGDTTNVPTVSLVVTGSA